ncbi:three-helix bundle dimerization domain-containing protein [Mycobacterium deserti]|uniref:Uncharacterized protein n=1 Tax=Mycobacterium deserti TaxID=2978347 RepID=A0ABT2MER9_9MYCO|nr:hypothetical protein [Mycobacterium deserti]MCT7660767.1 hypothetical protein [Mycobacterium deserti]
MGSPSQQHSEQQIVAQVAERLTAMYPSVPSDTIAAVVEDKYARFDGRPVRDFVPLFVERFARTELATLAN